MPFDAMRLRYHIAANMTEQLANRLLGDDPDLVDQAAQTLFSPLLLQEASRYGTSHSWMTGLSYNGRREVIRRLAEVTLQAADKLREHFITNRVSHGVARAILSATYAEDIQILAMHNGLILPVDDTKTHKPWKKGLTELQRLALRQRMIHAGISTIPICYHLLGKKKVPEGYGLLMLKASNEDFATIVAALRSPSRVTMPLPFTVC
ncbi:hypothetical protein CBS101457_000196 [Exobasidium rhododendri]|nr:hypothetical protein CBS101457_000196 [Exobasidium rhododendri]